MSLITISKNSYFNNLRIIEERVGGKEKIAVVLKDNAYGHGLLECAKLANEYGIKTAIVKNLREAKEISHLFDKILILFGTTFEQNSKYHYIINSNEILETIPKGTNVELKVDSGMHRNGIMPHQLEEVFESISKLGLRLKGVMTHYRGGDDLGSELFWQIKNFEEIKNRSENLASKYGFKEIKYHASSSSALFRQKSIEDDFVRVGISTYGYLELDEIFKEPPLEPILKLYAHKISTRFLRSGARIGYSGVSRLEKPEQISTYDIGYGDGFFRFKEGQNYILPEGEKLLPRVSMDSFGAISTKEKILLFEDAKVVAKKFGTISYDVLSKLSPFIQREIVD